MANQVVNLFLMIAHVGYSGEGEAGKQQNHHFLPCILQKNSLYPCLPIQHTSTGEKIMKSPHRDPVTRIRGMLAARRLDAILVTSPENRRYLSGFSAGDMGMQESSGALIVTRQENILLTDGRYKIQAEQEAPGWRVEIYRKGLAEQLGKIAKEITLSRLGYEPACITCAAMKRLEARLPDTEFVQLPPNIENMRAIKQPREISAIRRAIDVAEEVFNNVWETLEPGCTEREVAWEITRQLGEKSEGPSFPPIVASGPNAALPHAVPTDRLIQRGETVIIDMGAIVDGYCSDMTRTIIPGGDASTEIRKVYTTVQRAQAAAQDCIMAGMTGREADAVARKVIADAGYGRYFVHSLGHGVGLAVHEAPSLSPRARKKLRSGNVITVEPGIYIEGKCGVRLENMGLVEEDGLQVLSSRKWYYDFTR